MMLAASFSSFSGRFRVATLILALALAWFSIATILAEAMTPDPQGSMKVLNSKTQVSQSWLPVWPAATAPLRGDLASNVALARISIGGSTQVAALGLTPLQQDTLALARQSAALAPHLSQTWTLIAMMQARAQKREAVVSPLMMSYLTGPADADLIAIRLKIFASAPNAIADAELRNFARGDIRLILAHRPDMKDIIKEAFSNGTLDGRAFIEEVVRPLDPALLVSLR
jgi:hypothetical protein